MPSFVISNVASGQLITSGALGSGQRATPASEIRLKLAPNASGNIYVALSGGMTVNSGGLTDGYVVAPGQEYVIPRGSLTYLSGSPPNIYVRGDGATSGQARVYWEAH